MLLKTHKFSSNADFTVRAKNKKINFKIVNTAADIKFCHMTNYELLRRLAEMLSRDADHSLSNNQRVTVDHVPFTMIHGHVTFTKCKH